MKDVALVINYEDGSMQVIHMDGIEADAACVIIGDRDDVTRKVIFEATGCTKVAIKHTDGTSDWW